MLDQVAVRAGAFDVIHCHTEFCHAAVLRPWRDKTVMTIHWRADQPDRRACLDRFCDQKVVAISKAQAAALPESNCLDVVHHGMPANQLHLDDVARGYCAFLSRITDQKRPDLAIEIARWACLPIRLGGTVDIGNPDYFVTEVEPLLKETATHLGPITQNPK